MFEVEMRLKYAVLKGITIILMVLNLALFLISDYPDCLFFLILYFVLVLVLWAIFMMEGYEAEISRS